MPGPRGFDRSTFDYQRYLASREWAVRREAVRARCDGWCERCGLLPMAAAHHLTYEHIGDEPLEDLQAVCRSCHSYESGRSEFDPRAWAADIVDLTGSILWPERFPAEASPADLAHECGRRALSLAELVGVSAARGAVERLSDVLAYRIGAPTTLCDPRFSMRLYLLTLAADPAATME